MNYLNGGAPNAIANSSQHYWMQVQQKPALLYVDWLHGKW